MKKEQIYVTIDNEEKRLRAIEILDNAGEEYWSNDKKSSMSISDVHKYLYSDSDGWLINNADFGIREEITLDQLEALLLPNYQVKDVILSLDELKQQAEKLGYDLVEKPYEPKVGDFGVFWDEKEEGNRYYGFIIKIISDDYLFVRDNGVPFKNFRKLTEEEKQKIQESW
jgi:hypothetical protein